MMTLLLNLSNGDNNLNPEKPCYDTRSLKDQSEFINIGTCY